MKNIKIFRDSILTNEASFSTEEELQSWFSYHKGLNSFGTNESSYEREVTPAVYEAQQVEVEPGTFEEQQVLVTPAVTETVIVPASYTYTITDNSAELAAQAILDAKMAAGKAARDACQAVLDFIAGTNLDKMLTIEQITTMQQTFASAESALRAGRPSFARNFIEVIVPDGVIITEAEKAECLLLLTGY